MSSLPAPRPDAVDELERDRNQERLLFWKGLLALLVVIAVAWIRQRYFL